MPLAPESLSVTFALDSVLAFAFAVSDLCPADEGELADVACDSADDELLVLSALPEAVAVAVVSGLDVP